MSTVAQPQQSQQPGAWKSLRIVVPGFKTNKKLTDAFYELIANAIDTGSPDRIDTYPDIVIRDSGTGIELRDFLMGSRRPNSNPDSIGQHGLGLKEAITVLMRESAVVSIETVGRDFTFKIDQDPDFGAETLWIRETLCDRTEGTRVRVHNPTPSVLDAIVEAQHLFLALQRPPPTPLLANERVEMFANLTGHPVHYYYMLGARKGCNRPLHFIYNLLEATPEERSNVSSDHTTLCSKKFNKTVFRNAIGPIANQFAAENPTDPSVAKHTNEFHTGTPHAPLPTFTHAPAAARAPASAPAPTPSSDPLTRLVEQGLGSPADSVLFTLSVEEKNHIEATTNKLKALIEASPDLSVKRIENSGSLFKGTAVPGFGDVDVVVFLNNFRGDPEGVKTYAPILKSILHMAEFRPSAPDILQFHLDGVDFDVVLTSDESTNPRYVEFARGPDSVRDLRATVGPAGDWVYDVIRAAKYWAKRKEAACGNVVLKSLAIELIVTHCFLDLAKLENVLYAEKRRVLFRAFLAFLRDCGWASEDPATWPALHRLSPEKQRSFNPEFHAAARAYGAVAL